MSATGLKVFDKPIQTTNIWLGENERRLPFKGFSILGAARASLAKWRPGKGRHSPPAKRERETRPSSTA
ncbi:MULTISPECIES: hypothetical protein [unclassified Sphingobium]|uniref:hypothetical protein n=1 Tax=unclassified Sphingobium TaxID=2611147 RepID=UPI0012EDD7F0|nr:MULTISPECIES: hypothetical protein [unclassified Sphingobium]UZW57891.1 hypothetical protein NUH86_23080 [Sphingobium sp. JS3065]